MSTGQLEVWPWQDGPLRGGRFDQEIWLASFERALQSGPAAGYPRTRFFAHMEWALVKLPGVDDLIEFEGLLHENPFFVSPDQLLPEIRERRSARNG